jgi:hypothetical protein
MGLQHGTFCVGCCWMLMALLFVGGVMNVLWIAALAIFVLAEKVAPYGAGTRHGCRLLGVGYCHDDGVAGVASSTSFSWRRYKLSSREETSANSLFPRPTSAPSPS